MIQSFLTSYSPARSAALVCGTALLMVGSPAQAAQCLTKMVQDRDGSLVQLQVLEPAGGPKTLISKQGFARSNCKELDAKAQAYAQTACAQAETLPGEIQELIKADLGFSLAQMCAMGQDADNEAKAAKGTAKTKD